MTQNLSPQGWMLGLVTSLALGGVIAFSENFAFAQQVKSDHTLGTESSIVQPDISINGIPSDLIKGGAIRGTNLLHSFEEFNVGEGQGVYFDNPSGVKLILSRVTGNNLSNILGTLGVLRGNADLFLINPNGIIFGPHASLDLKGSFLATTANSLNFADGTQFSATSPSAPSLLTVSVPVGLQFGKTPGLIINQAQGIDSNGLPTGLQVQPGKTLALVGGDITMQEGILVAFEGRIELGSVADSSNVSLKPIEKGWELGYEGAQNFMDIRLLQSSMIATDGQGSGDIQIQGRRVTIADGSKVFANVISGSQPGGTLKITASDSVELMGINPGGQSSGLFTATISPGDAGNIIIDTRKLLLQDGATISTEASFTQLVSGEFERSTGRAGNLTVNASKSVEISNGSELNSATSGSGDAGNLRIETEQLIVRNGSQISSVASEGSTGNGGNVTIKTRQLNISDGASVTVSSFGTGIAGNLFIDPDLVKLDRGTLTAQTQSGEGGNITIQGGNIQLRNNSLISTQASGSGNGGNITINAGTLVGLENSDIIANALNGKGGFIQIKAQGVFGLEPREQLTPQSDITAFSQKNPELNGTVKINTLVNNPSQGLVTLPVKPVDVTGQIAQGCPAGVGPRASKFVVTGRGGLPPDPTEALRSEPTLADLGTTVQSQENRTSATTSSSPTSSEPAPLMEAQGWVTNAKGEVVLVAQAPTVTLHIPWLTSTTCLATKSAS